MHRAIEFRRAMRARGFAYRRLRRGVGQFVRCTRIGDSKAYFAPAISLTHVIRVSAPIERIADHWAETADRAFARLAERIAA